MEEKIKSLYNSIKDKNIKKLFIETFGEEMFSSLLWDKVLEYNNISKEDFNKKVEFLTDSEKSNIEMEMIAKYYNQQWTPNWQDSSESKYFIWWNLEKNCFDCVIGYYHVTIISSRLCFKRREDVERAVREFPDIVKRYFSCI